MIRTQSKGKAFSRGALALWMMLVVGSPISAVASDDDYPLEPPNTSSPRGTLYGFLDVTDEVARRYLDYRDSPSIAAFGRMVEADERVVRFLDLSQVAPAARPEVGANAYVFLWETLARIELPPAAAIPGAQAFADRDDEVPDSWSIPHTAITIARVEEGPRAGEFLFSPQTVRRASEFFRRTRHLPYRRQMLIEDPHQIDLQITGFLIPMAWVEALPVWLKGIVFEQVLWKWLLLLLLLVVVFGVVVLLSHWLNRNVSGRPWGVYMRRLAAPGSILILMPLVLYLTQWQINVSGSAAEIVQVLLPAVTYLAGAWAFWLVALAVVEWIIASPRILNEGLDAHLLRLAARVIAIGGIVVILLYGGAELGLPLYGLIAGVGVGGLAVALAAQNTLENFLGSINLYADRPVRVGDFCRYGDDAGTVEEIGLRSTRIRGRDRTVTTIPNAEFSKMKIVNYTRRDQILMHTTLGLRYETSDEQLRFVATKLRELLFAHPRVSDEPARVRFVGFGDFSLDLEVFAYLRTNDYNESLAIKEDVLLRMKKVVEEAGTGFAFPSRTIYQANDHGLNRERTEAAEGEVASWRAARDLRFLFLEPTVWTRSAARLTIPPTVHHGLLQAGIRNNT